MKFSLKIPSVNRPNPHETADLVAFTEEVLNGKLHFSVQRLVASQSNILFKVYLVSDT